jgi:quercetin dioxygenase-like cupin family protein
MATPIIVEPDMVAWETWREPALAARSLVRWKDLLGRDRREGRGLSVGIAEVPPGATLAQHRHRVSEVYYVLSGTGRLFVDGQEYTLAAGFAADIPGNAEHALTNLGSEPLIFIYIFPVEAFADLVYEFPALEDG